MYAVKEIFYTLQGEGAQTGRAAVFCRFAGCNLWSGREPDRASAICKFCDTDFADTNGPGGGKFASAEELAAAIKEKWPARARDMEADSVSGGETADPRSTPIAAAIFAQGRLSTSVAVATSAQDDRGPGKFVVCTGGEPLLQLDAALTQALHAQGFEIAAETNGTIVAPPGIDWLCVSPKAGSAFRQRGGDEIKLVYPQPGIDPADFESLPFRHFFLQPMDGPNRDANTQAAVRYCLDHPPWRLSLQTHKFLGIP